MTVPEVTHHSLKPAARRSYALEPGTRDERMIIQIKQPYFHTSYHIPHPCLSREAALDRLERERFDLLIVGGGITGAAIAHLAARSNLRVALVEQNDFASGTSSRSS